MTRRELLMSAVRNEETPRPAWVPFVGCHGAFLIDRTATEYLHSSELIVEGLTKARELYDPDGLPITFDLQMEAENLGCGLMWSDDGPPTVTTHPLAEGKTLADLPEFSTEQGRFPLVMEALRDLRTHLRPVHPRPAPAGKQHIPGDVRRCRGRPGAGDVLRRGGQARCGRIH